MARQGETLSECWGFSSAIDPGYEQKYIDYYHSVNPIWQRASSTPVGTVQTDTMVTPRRLALLALQSTDGSWTHLQSLDRE
jgi:hypothetical protein